MKQRIVRLFPAALALMAGMAWSAGAAAQPFAAPPPWQQWYWSITAGSYRAEDNTRLAAPGSEIALGVAVGYRYSRHVSFEVEVPFFYAEYDTPATVPPPPYGTVEERSSVNTAGIVTNVVLNTGGQWVRAYVGAGAGLYWSRFSVSAQVFGYPGTYERDDSDVGTQWLTGADLRVGRGSWLGLQYRQVDLRANFGSVTNADVDLGGRFFLLAYRNGF